MASAQHRGFDQPDAVREMPFGHGDIINIGGTQILKVTLQPGWRWSEHVKPIAKTELCEAPHFQVLLAGTMGVRMADGTEFEVATGEVSILPAGHDAWVIGDEPVVAVDWGAAHVWATPAP